MLSSNSQMFTVAHTCLLPHIEFTFVTDKKMKSNSMHTLNFFVLIRNISLFCKDLFNVIRFIYLYSVLPICMYITCIQWPQEGGHQIPLTGVGCHFLCECSCQTWVHCKSNKCSYLLSHLSISLSLFVRKWNAAYIWSSLVACFIGFPVYLVREIIISLTSLLLSLTHML